MQFQKTILSNGLRLLTVPMPSFESATVMVMVGAGSRYEKKSNSGISHFLEHMAFKGTKKRPSAIEISALIDGMGGEFNAFTSKETTGYYIKSSASNIETSMDVLSDMLQNSLFDEKEIEKEKGVIMEEINMVEDNPMRKIGDIYEMLLYGDTPMGWDIAGKKEIIKQITRQDFVNYMSSLYSAANIAVVVAGGINTEKTKDLVGKYFNKMSQFDTVPYIKVVEKQSKPKVGIREKKTEQVHVALGIRTVPSEHPDRYPLDMLASVLGGGMSSRLFHEVREKRGLAYYVRSSSDHYQDCGSLVSTAGIDPKRVGEAVKVMVEEYGKVANNFKVTDAEIKKAKEFTKGHLVLEFEDSRSVAGFYAGQELLEKKVDNLYEVLEKIGKVTVEEVNEVAKRYMVDSQLNLAIIGNITDRQKFESLLKI